MKDGKAVDRQRNQTGMVLVRQTTRQSQTRKTGKATVRIKEKTELAEEKKIQKTKETQTRETGRGKITDQETEETADQPVGTAQETAVDLRVETVDQEAQTDQAQTGVEAETGLMTRKREMTGGTEVETGLTLTDLTGDSQTRQRQTTLVQEKTSHEETADNQAAETRKETIARTRVAEEQIRIIREETTADLGKIRETDTRQCKEDRIVQRHMIQLTDFVINAVRQIITLFSVGHMTDGPTIYADDATKD